MKSNSFTVLTDVRVVRDPEKRLAGEKELLSFTVADNPGDEKFQTKFITVTVSGKLVEIFSVLKKGDRVNVTGKELVKTYKKNNGETGLDFSIPFPMTCTRVYTDQLQVVDTVGTSQEAVTVTNDITPKKGPGRPKKMPWEA